MLSESTTIPLSTEERLCLLRIARDAVLAAARGERTEDPDLDALAAPLRETKACFVTLHKLRELRGCTGVLVGRSPLALEVVRTAGQTALYDPRFPPVRPDEVPDLDIEISVLTPPQRLVYSTASDLIAKLRPGIDGVTLIKGPYRATFLPQVWERISEPETFLSMLCQKMGLPGSAWRLVHLDVETYQVEEFSDHSMKQM